MIGLSTCLSRFRSLPCCSMGHEATTTHLSQEPKLPNQQHTPHLHHCKMFCNRFCPVQAGRGGQREANCLNIPGYFQSSACCHTWRCVHGARPSGRCLDIQETIGNLKTNLLFNKAVSGCDSMSVLFNARARRPCCTR